MKNNKSILIKKASIYISFQPVCLSVCQKRFNVHKLQAVVIRKANFQENTNKKKLSPQDQSCGFASAPKFGKKHQKLKLFIFKFFEIVFS
jgi:hypothetical protein